MAASGCYLKAPRSPQPSRSRAGAFILSERRLHVYAGAHVLVAQEAGVGGQGIVGENGVVVGRAGAGGVLTRRGVLLEGCRQVQVLTGERKFRG